MADRPRRRALRPPWRRRPGGGAGQPFPPIRDHVLLPFAGSIEEADARLAPRLDGALLERIASELPPEWGDGAVYAEHLARRLDAPRAFAEEAERARA